MPDLWRIRRRALGTLPRAAVGGVAVGAAIAGEALNAWWSEERGLWSAQRDLTQQEIDSLRGHVTAWNRKSTRSQVSSRPCWHQENRNS